MQTLPGVKFPEATLQNASVLALAHIGDAVFELLARSLCVADGGITADSLHRATVSLVAAPAQAKAAKKIEQQLSEEELAVLKRGRNARSRTNPKGATVEEYRLSTALEALFGYLYIKGDEQRISELFALCMEGEDAS